MKNICFFLGVGIISLYFKMYSDLSFLYCFSNLNCAQEQVVTHYYVPRGLIEDAEKPAAPPSTTGQDLDGDPACDRRPLHPQPQETELP